MTWAWLLGLWHELTTATASMEIIPAVPIIITVINWIAASITPCPCNLSNDPAALSILLSKLSNSRSDLDSILEFCTALVVVGVIIETITVPTEFILDFLEHKRDMRDWAQGICPRPHGPSWLSIIEFAGAMLVAIGVGGELLYGHAIGKIDVCMQLANSMRAHILEGELTAQRARASCLQKQAEDEQLARVKLEEFVNPRRLTADQRREIAAILKPFKGKLVTISTYRQDAEAMLLATQIAQALSAAKIEPRDMIGTFGPIGLPLMLGVDVGKKSRDKELASALIKALKTKGKLLVSSTDEPLGEGSTVFLKTVPKREEDAFIFVGAKPLRDETPPQPQAANTPCPAK